MFWHKKSDYTKQWQEDLQHFVYALIKKWSELSKILHDTLGHEVVKVSKQLLDYLLSAYDLKLQIINFERMQTR